MKKDEYEDLLEEMSEQLAKKFFETENDLANRALYLDKDISDKLRTLGQKATKKILEKVRDEIVVEKKRQQD